MIGVAIAYGLIAIVVSWGLGFELGGAFGNKNTEDVIAASVIFAGAMFIRGRAGAFLKQRNFVAGIILSIIFVLLATFATVGVLVSARKAELINMAAVGSATFGAFIIYIIIAVRKIRSYR